VYLCSCKGLTESDIKAIAQEFARAGVPAIGAFLQYLDLNHEDGCGLCAQAPEDFSELAVEEWLRLGIEYRLTEWDT
jgi:hypothetical protein